MSVPSEDEYAKALKRIGGMVKLPSQRIAEVFAQATQEIEGKGTEAAPAMERAVMLACERLWAEEKQGPERKQNSA